MGKKNDLNEASKCKASHSAWHEIKTLLILHRLTMEKKS